MGGVVRAWGTMPRRGKRKFRAAPSRRAPFATARDFVLKAWAAGNSFPAESAYRQQAPGNKGPAMTLHAFASATFLNGLRMLLGLLDKTDAGASLQARLAPDMYPLIAQVQLATGLAAGAMAQLSGGEAPKMEMTETTLDEIKARIASTVAYVESVPESAFAGAEARSVVIPIPAMQIAFHMTGEEMLRDWSLPNFYFHIVTAYDILRAQGAKIGKQDFMPQVAAYVRPHVPGDNQA